MRDGGSAGNGGNVTVDFDGSITTSGHGAIGILAQSVGGGGGLAGDTGFGLLNEIKDVLACSFVEGASGAGDAVSQGCNAWVGSAGGDGSGGVIDIMQTGTIETFGDVAHGIFAQSSGGAADDIQPMVVKLDDDGDVVMEDDQPVYEAASGSDVRGDLADLGGDINITVENDVLAHGAFAHGIFAHSGGDDGSGDITIEILSGTVQGGTNTGVGVRFMGSGQNTLNNAGTITSADGASGEAIFAGLGDETITNTGIITGSIDLGGGSNAFVNRSGATFNSGRTVNLGSGTALTNEGSLSPGGKGRVMMSSIDGSVLQTESGQYEVDIDMADGSGDLIDVSGSVEMNGKIVANPHNKGNARPGTRSTTILTAGEQVTDMGIDFEYEESIVVDYVLDFPDAQTITVATTVDFTPEALDGNRAAVAEYVHRILQQGGSEAFAPTTAALLSIPDAEAYGEAMDALSPKAQNADTTTTLMSNLQLAGAMLSCRSRDGDYRFIREGQCGWMRLAGRTLESNDAGGQQGFEEDAFGLSGGFQWAIDDTWNVGLALSFEDSEATIGQWASSDGYRVQAGGIVKARWGGLTFSTALSGGIGDYDTTRVVNLPNPGTLAYGNQETQFVSLNGRLAYAFEWASWYLRPYLGAGFSYLDYGDFAEQGAGALNLQISRDSDSLTSVQPGIELGGEFRIGKKTLVRPFLRAGVIHFLSEPGQSVTATFEGAPTTIEPFTITNDGFDDTFTEVAVGFNIFAPREIDVRVNYSGLYSDDLEQGSIMVKIAKHF
jgi:uncharacterized protein with beta-barrel porin domain